MRRNPVLIRVLLVAPILQLIMLGYAATTDVKNVPVVICDQSGTRESREIVDAIAASAYFELIGQVRDFRDLRAILDAGTAQLALHIPVDYARKLRRHDTAELALYIDGSDSVTANTAAAYLMGLLEDQARDVMLRRLTRAGLPTSAPSVEMVPRVWFNPELRSANYTVPGVFGLIIMIITTVWTSQSIVREREVGTLEQLVVTPVRPLELLLGKSLPYAVTALIAAG